MNTVHDKGGIIIAQLWHTGLTNKLGSGAVNRYTPDEHYWPGRSYHPAVQFKDNVSPAGVTPFERSARILQRPERIDVAAPIPDYPPLVFRYKAKEHRIARADGPERIEQEWWIQHGEHHLIV